MRQEHVNLFRNAIEARKIGFPNVIMPGDVRNDLYLTIEQGVFERGGKVSYDQNFGRAVTQDFLECAG